MAEDKDATSEDSPEEQPLQAEAPSEEGNTSAEEEQPEAEEGRGHNRRPDRAGLWLGIVALILVLAVGGAGGYAYWRLESRLTGTQEAISGAETGRSQIRSDLSRLENELEGLGQRQEEATDRTAEHATRLDTLQEAINELRQRIEGGPTYWRMERIEGLLLAANRVARLEGDPEAARVALEEADTLLQELKDPAWLSAREAIQDAMTRLEQAPAPDIPGIVLRLGSLEETALTMPIDRRDRAQVEGPTGDKPASGGEDTGSLWQRIRSGAGAFWKDLKGLVRLRRTTEEVQPLLPPDQAVYLRHNLVLTLQSAKVAALRGRGQVYEDALAKARDWTGRFFDPESDDVAAMASALEELQARPVETEVPELNQPLEAFRRIRKERAQ